MKKSRGRKTFSLHFKKSELACCQAGYVSKCGAGYKWQRNEMKAVQHILLCSVCFNELAPINGVVNGEDGSHGSSAYVCVCVYVCVCR